MVGDCRRKERLWVSSSTVGEGETSAMKWKRARIFTHFSADKLSSVLKLSFMAVG